MRGRARSYDQSIVQSAKSARGFAPEAIRSQLAFFVPSRVRAYAPTGPFAMGCLPHIPRESIEPDAGPAHEGSGGLHLVTEARHPSPPGRAAGVWTQRGTLTGCCSCNSNSVPEATVTAPKQPR